MKRRGSSLESTRTSHDGRRRNACPSYAQNPLESGESIVAAHFSNSASDLNSRAEVTAAIALKNADAVDHEARFPIEAIQSAREQRLLGMMVPVELGGEGASISDAVDACYIIARGCSSSAMIFAMHQIMVAILVRHAANSPWHMRLMRRLASEQLLLASSTTEGSGGGDLRKANARWNAPVRASRSPRVRR